MRKGVNGNHVPYDHARDLATRDLVLYDQVTLRTCILTWEE